MLVKVKHDYNTTKMSKEDSMYWLHFLSGDRMIGDYCKSQLRLNPQFRREVLQQPVCAKCEKFCFYHKGGAMCPSCGHWTPENQTHKVKRHIKEGHYR